MEPALLEVVFVDLNDVVSPLDLYVPGAARAAPLPHSPWQ